MARRRKKKQEEHVNHERWLVSYADFITLLFAFFVVMYSISSVNQGKYRVLSDSLNAAFRSPPKSMDPIQVGDPLRSYNIFTAEAPLSSAQMQSMIDAGLIGNAHGRRNATMQEMADDLEDTFRELIDEEMVDVRKTDDRIEVALNSKILFQLGSSTLTSEAIPVIAKMSGILENSNNRIQVEGFTDNLPIRSTRFPSNWELSAGRAATVVRLFAEFGVNPGNLSSVGFGEHQPIADNSTAAGRAKNRRVVIVIKARQDSTQEAPLQGLQEKFEQFMKTQVDIPSPLRLGPELAPAVVPPVISREIEAAEDLL